MRWLLAIGELALMCWFIAVGLEALVQRAVGMRSPFQLREFHHAYLGVLIVILGWSLQSVTGTLVQCLGIIFTLDDLYQHQRQTLGGDVEYQSPLHHLFGTTLWRIHQVQLLVELLDRWWLALGALGLLAIWLFGCAPAYRLPMASRPDTRELTGILFDSVTVRQTAEHLRAAYPKEGAVCLYGTIRDTTIDGVDHWLVFLDSARPSHADSANESHIWYAGAQSECPISARLVGIAHSHPHTPTWSVCTHSEADAMLLFGDPRALFSIVFCGDRAEILYQDGRRYTNRWIVSLPSSP